jgi:hypothetical protein
MIDSFRTSMVNGGTNGRWGIAHGFPFSTAIVARKTSFPIRGERLRFIVAVNVPACAVRKAARRHVRTFRSFDADRTLLAGRAVG